MYRQLLAIIALLAGVALLGLANSLMFILLGVRMSIDQVSSEMTGVVGSAYFAGMLLGSLYASRVIHRVGHIRAFTVFAAVSAIAVLLTVVFPMIIVWALLRVAAGFSSAAMFIIAESWLQSQATNETRGRTYALYALSGTLGAGCGPLLINLGDPATDELFILAALILMFCLLPVAMTRVSNPSMVEEKRFGLRALFALSPVAVVGAFSAGMVTSAVSALGPVFGERIGLSTAYIAFLLMGMRLGSFVMQYPVGALSDRFDRRRVMIALALCAASVSLVLFLSGTVNPIAVLILGFLFGGVNQPLYGLSVAHANDFADKDNFVSVSAGLLLGYGLGATVGPTLAAPIMDRVGPAGLFLYAAVILVFTVLFIIYRSTRRAPVATEDLGHYIAVHPSLMGSGVRLDPRSLHEDDEGASHSDRIHEPPDPLA